VEIWPSLRAEAVRQAQRPDDIRDAVQVRVTADWLAGLAPDALHAMLDVNHPEEGWILGLEDNA
jgi:molybdopterin molybdotransferase